MKSYHICQICWEEIIYVSWPVSSSKPMIEHLEKHVKDLIDNKSKESSLSPLFPPFVTLFWWGFVRADSWDEIYWRDQKWYLYTLKKLDQDLNN